MSNLKDDVRSHWEEESCGTRYGSSDSRSDYFEEIEQARYRLESYIPGFAHFDQSAGKQVLEIGVGAGTDFRQWVENGARATGVDLTNAAIELARENVEARSPGRGGWELRVDDAENLSFDDEQFDIVYSWGVLHHSPDTVRAIAEAYRVLKPGGTVRAMIYHDPSWTGWMLWAMHCLLRGKPFQSPRKAVFDQLESPGTKAYSLAEADAMLRDAGFRNRRVHTRLGPGDLLLTKPSEKYQGLANRVIWAVYPRWLVRLLGDRFGLYLLMEAEKPA